ncbi:MAG: lysoplasmalogenase [Acidobacteriota bacterium]|nr:lysoplasmalogenase [Acidobacteriota bacterium]
MPPAAARLRIASLAASAIYLLSQNWQPYPGSAFIKGFSVAALAWMAYRESSLLLGTALLLSSIGDVLLDLDPGLFVFGLCAFLSAHVLYTAVFIRHRARPFAPSGARIALMVITAGYAALFARWLIPGLGSLAVPVAIYICAITAMVLSALLARFPTSLPVLGTFLFYASDSILAIDRFKTRVPMRGFLVWTTYYFAQYLIANGARRVPRPRVD